LPGFVDLHIHAPQWPQLGKALDVPLEVWLQQYTFPLEARYSDVDFAERVYGDMVDNLLAEGTTTAVYFATIHDGASRALAEICLAKGQLSWTTPSSARNTTATPPPNRHSPRAPPSSNTCVPCPATTTRWSSRSSPRASSRAAPTTPSRASATSRKDRTGKTDTDALNDFGLLGRHTVLAHSNFLTDANMDTIREAGAGVAHCPLSNIYFSNAVFPLRRALDKAVRVGLGTDISGGPSPSILDNARQAIHSSRLFEEGVSPDLQREDRRTEGQRIDFREALHLATAGGADVLDIPVGRFEAGYHFDALCIDPNAKDAPINYDPALDSEDDLVQKVVNLARRVNIQGVWTTGKSVPST